MKFPPVLCMQKATRYTESVAALIGVIVMARCWKPLLLPLTENNHDDDDNSYTTYRHQGAAVHVWRPREAAE